jgi:phage terminase small subunit
MAIGNLPSSNTGKSLTHKQQRFVDEYIIDLNGTQAAIRAGYATGSAFVAASRLLSNDKVAAAITKRKKEREKRTEITQDRVLQELYRLAFVDIRKYFNEDGTAKPMSELDDDAAAALAGFEVVEINSAPGSPPVGFTKKFRLTEKKGSIELLMRHMGMLNDKLKLQGDEKNPITLALKQINGTALPVVPDNQE